MKIIEISEDTCGKMSECVEDIITSAQSLMQHLKKSHPHMQDEDEEEPYRSRRRSMRHDDDSREEDEYDYRQPSRRERDRSSSYSRY